MFRVVSTKMLCWGAVTVTLPPASLRFSSSKVFNPSPFRFQKQSWKRVFLGSPPIVNVLCFAVGAFSVYQPYRARRSSGAADCRRF